MVGAEGVEPSSLAYQTNALPLCYAPLVGQAGVEPSDLEDISSVLFR